MSSEAFDPRLFVRSVGERPLCGPALLDLAQAVLAKEVPVRFRALGSSMSPFIKDGDLITVEPLARALPRVGDVVAFARPGTGRLVVHRVVGRRGESYLIMGDRGTQPESPVPPASILGRVCGVERRGRRIRLGLGPERALIALATRTGLLSGLLLPAWRLMRALVGGKGAARA